MRSSHELTRMKNLYMCHTDLQQDFSVVRFFHQIDRALFHASFSHGIFLVRASRTSFSYVCHGHKSWTKVSVRQCFLIAPTAVFECG